MKCNPLVCISCVYVVCLLILCNADIFISPQNKLPKAHREESCASSASSISSYHSEHTGSSLPSSSSEGIGPTGKDTPTRKHRAKRESDRNRTSQKSDSMKLNSAHKERSRQRESHARRADTGHAKRRSTRDRGKHPEMGVEQRISIDQFATSLSVAIIDDSLRCYRDDRWLRVCIFLSLCHFMLQHHHQVSPSEYKP